MMRSCILSHMPASQGQVQDKVAVSYLQLNTSEEPLHNLL